MFKFFRERKKNSLNQRWTKVEDKSDGPLSWTEYTDYNGYVYTIYDMMISPGFSEAVMKNNDI